MVPMMRNTMMIWKMMKMIENEGSYLITVKKGNVFQRNTLIKITKHLFDRGVKELFKFFL